MGKQYFFDKIDNSTYELWCEYQPAAGKLAYDYICSGTYEFCKAVRENMENEVAEVCK